MLTAGEDLAGFSLPNWRDASSSFFLNLFIVSLAGLPLFQIYFSKDGETIADKYSKTILKKI